MKMVEKSSLRSEKGVALLFAVIISVLLMALGLGLTLSSLSEFSMSNEFESHEQSLMIADAGLNASESFLRGRDLSEVLSETTTTPTFFSSGPTDPRNPTTLADARNVDFYNLPSATGSVQLAGLLTPASGVQLGRGRYFARVSDNDDGDGNPFMDLDHIIFIRSFGVQPGPPNEIVMNGSNLKNSVAIVEGMLKRDLSFDVSSPFTVYGPDAIPEAPNMFDGNAFLIDGHDHSDQAIADILRGTHNHRNDDSNSAAISAINNDPGANDAQTSVNSVADQLSDGQENNLTGGEGAFGPDGPSIRDDTDMVRNSPNPDARNIFDPEYLATFIDKVSAAADQVYEDGTTLSGNNILLGTEDNPQITVALGDFALAGNGSGSGLLIVKGLFDYSGAFDFNGLILVVGDGSVNISGANKSIIGGMYLAQLLDNGDGTHTFGNPSFTVSGSSSFYFRGDSIKLAMNLLPFRKLAWREITQEMMPPVTVHEEPPDDGDGGGGIGIIGVTP
jgi:Tfp pilus assembly protein PilV